MFVVGIIVFVSFVLDITSCAPVTVVPGATLSPEKKEVDKKMNKIMIPISFVLLFIVALIAWLLNRSHKKKKEQEDREMQRRYTTLLKAKTAQVNSTEPVTSESTLPVDNSSEIPMTQFRQVGGGSRPALPEQDNSENEPDIPAKENRHRRRKMKIKKKASKNASADESSDVCENEAQKSDSDLPKRLQKKARRRRARKSGGYQASRIMREHDGIQKAEEMIEEKERGYQDKGNSEVNGGFQRDSEDVGSTTRTSGDSALGSSSVVSAEVSAQQSRTRNLSPIAQVVQNDDNRSIEL